MHAVSTNQIADILHVNDNMIYNMKIREYELKCIMKHQLVLQIFQSLCLHLGYVAINFHLSVFDWLRISNKCRFRLAKRFGQRTVCRNSHPSPFQIHGNCLNKLFRPCQGS